MSDRRSGLPWRLVVLVGLALVVLNPPVASMASDTFTVVESDFTRNLGGVGGTLSGLGRAGAAAILLQPDGKIVMVGDFLGVGGAPRAYIARLNGDGTPDTDFSAALGTGPYFVRGPTNRAIVDAVALQPDGKILVGGMFHTWDGTAVHNLVRLEPDGSLDRTFVANLGSGLGVRDSEVFTGLVMAIAVQPDGKIIVGGHFNTADGHDVAALARFGADGVYDASFAAAQPSPSSVFWSNRHEVRQLALQPDGRLLVGSNELRNAGLTSQPLVRLLADGSLDTTFAFDPGATFTGYLSVFALQPDGAIVVGGMPDGYPRSPSYLARVLPDGSPDAAFAANLGTGISRPAVVSAITVRPDGTVLVAGSFAVFNGKQAVGMVRLRADGGRDVEFPSVVVYPYDGLVAAIVVQPDERLVIAGSFIYPLGTYSPVIARLETQPALPEVGIDAAPLVWAAAALVATGVVLVLSRRSRPFLR